MTDTDIALLRIIQADIAVALPVLKAAAEQRVLEGVGEGRAVAAMLRLHHAHGLLSGLIDIETKETA